MGNHTSQIMLESIKFDRAAPIPFYQQLKDGLTDAIRASTLPPGMQLPSEREFCEYFGVSRLTVRRALNDLATAGWVMAQPGKGTFVRPHQVEQGVQQLMGLSEDMKKRGYAVTSEVLQLRVMPVPPELASRMKLAPTDEVVLLERLRYLDGVPLALEHSYLTHRYCPGIANHDLTTSLYRILRQVYGLGIAHAEQVYEAVAAGEREARLLHVEPRAPLLCSERTTFLDNGHVIEQGTAWFRGDRYKFRTVLLDGAAADGEH